MQDRPEIIVPYSPLDGIASSPRSCAPGRRDHCHKHDRLVRETEKTAEIQDNFGFLRFKVYLYSSASDAAVEQSKQERVYEVSVASFVMVERDPGSLEQSEEELGENANGLQEPSQDDGKLNLKEEVIFSKQFSTLREASKCYDDNVRQYSLIAKVETQHYQDIEIYADKIGYRRVDECCGNCRWCHPKMIGENVVAEWNHGLVPHLDKFGRRIGRRCGSLVCLNYKIFAKRLTDIESPDFDELRVQPEVDPGCVCNYFEKRLPPTDPHFHNHARDQYGDELPQQPPKSRRDSTVVGPIR